MNNKKSKRLRKILKEVYGEKFQDKEISSIYKKLKKRYLKLDKKSKESLLNSSEAIVSMLKKEV